MLVRYYNLLLISQLFYLKGWFFLVVCIALFLTIYAFLPDSHKWQFRKKIKFKLSKLIKEPVKIGKDGITFEWDSLMKKYHIKK